MNHMLRGFSQEPRIQHDGCNGEIVNLLAVADALFDYRQMILPCIRPE